LRPLALSAYTSTEDDQMTRTLALLAGALILFPALTPADPHSNANTRRTHNNHRIHFATGIRWAHPRYTGCYQFNGSGWGYVAFPYAGLGVNNDFVYQGHDISDDIYPYAIPTSDPNVVISPFALNNLVDVTGIPEGARVRDPVSEEIFLRP
jgi:hypothetical protein